MVDREENEEIVAALLARLSDYDGRATSILGEAEAALAGVDGYLDALIGLLTEAEERTANGVSWLMKSALQRGGALSEAQVRRMVGKLSAIEHWAVQLHICQSIRLLNVPHGAAEPLAQWLCDLLDHERPFVRAWALDGLGAVASSYERFEGRYTSALEAALDDPAASVRARARNLVAGRGSGALS